MNRIIDTGDKILCGDNHPQLKIGNKIYLVDDRKSTFDKIQEVQQDTELNDDAKTEKVLALALGEAEAKELLDDPTMTVSGYANLSIYVMAAITGESFEDFKKAVKEQSKN